MKNKLLKIITICLLVFTKNINAQMTLWGVTQFGGTSGGNGVLYKTDADGRNLQVMVNFSGTTGSYQGKSPLGSLIKASNGKLYGLTRKGGTSDNGTIFSYDISSSTFTTVYSFSATTLAPSEPMGSFTEVNNKLYATTSLGGTGNSGTIFTYDLATNTYSTIVNFTGASAPYYGSMPVGISLLHASNGLLYGTTSISGLNNNGTLFSLDPANNNYSTIINFTGTTGSFIGGKPYGGVIEVNNKLFGTTNVGGTAGFGTIYSVDMSTEAHSVLASFTGSVGTTKGAKAKNALTLVNGLLYGTAANLGPNGGDYGVVFSIDPVTNTYSTVVNFSGTNGSHPYCTLLHASNGNLYGMTNGGGSNSSGTLFEYNITTNTHTVLTNFNSTNGSAPGYAKLLEIDASITTEVNENNKNNVVDVYPNPANQSISIQGVDFNETVSVKIISIDGKLMKEMKTTTSTIDVSELNSGMYFIELKNKEAKIGVTKFIKE